MYGTTAGGYQLPRVATAVPPSRLPPIVWLYDLINKSDFRVPSQETQLETHIL
jgi:hypothetical protein